MLMGLHSSIGVRFSRGRLLFSYTYHEPEKIFKKLIWITVTTPTQTQLTQPQPKITKAGFDMKMTPPQLEKNTTFFPFFLIFILMSPLTWWRDDIEKSYPVDNVEDEKNAREENQEHQIHLCCFHLFFSNIWRFCGFTWFLVILTHPIGMRK